MVHKLMESLVHHSANVGVTSSKTYVHNPSCTNPGRQPHRLVCMSDPHTQGRGGPSQRTAPAVRWLSSRLPVCWLPRANQPPAVAWGLLLLASSSRSHAHHCSVKQQLACVKACVVAKLLPLVLHTRHRVGALCRRAVLPLLLLLRVPSKHLLGLLEVLDQVGHICFFGKAETGRGHRGGQQHTAQHSTPRSGTQAVGLLSLQLLRCHWRARDTH